MKNDAKPLLISYLPGARGDFLISSLLNKPIVHDKFGKCAEVYHTHEFKGIEKFDFGWSLANPIADDKLDHFVDAVLNFPIKINVCCCHSLYCLQPHHVQKLKDKFEVYQIALESHNVNIVWRLGLVKNHASLYKDTSMSEKLDRLIYAFKEANHFYKNANTLSLNIGANLLWYDSLFSNTYDAYSALYRTLNQREPNLRYWRKKVRDTMLPKTAKIFDIDCEIDIEAGIIKPL